MKPPASPSPLDQAKSPKTRQNELNKIIYNFTSLPTTTVRKGKSLKWLRALIEKLYDYSYGLFQKSDDSILDESYSVSLILYSIMDTKFVFKSITDLNWFDMITATKKYRSQDWEIDLFCRFLTGEYTLKCFFWFVCSRALLMLKKKKRLSTDTRQERKKIQHNLNRIVSNNDVQQDNSFSSDYSQDYSSGITLEKVVRVLIELANKGLIHTSDFSSAHEYLANFSLVEKDIYNFVRKKFEDSIQQNERGQSIMSFSAFLGYLIKVKKDSVEKLFEELKQYLDASDFSGSPNVSLNTSLENDKVYEKVMKAKIEDDTDLILSYSDGGSEDIQRYYDKLKEQEDELNEQKRNYTLSPMKSNDSFTEESDTVSIKSITDKLSKGSRASANDIISDVEELVEVALRKLNRYQSREIELEDQLFFLQLDTFLHQLVQRNDMGEYWILRLNELKDMFSDELQVKQPDYKMYQSELLRDNIRARGNLNDLLFLDMGEKAKLASLIDAEDEHDGSEISENESNIVPLIIDEENIILPRIVQEPEPDEPQLPLQIPEKILHGTPVSEDERANPFATYQEEELSSEEEDDNVQDYSSSDVENEDRTGNEDLDSEYETEEEKRARLFKKEQRRRERELKAKKEEEDAYEFEYTEEVTESHSPNHALHMQQLEQLELLQKNYSESQLSQIQSLVKHQEELYEIQKRRISGSRLQDLISDGTPTRKERNLKLIEVEEDADDWRTGSILEDAYFKSELFEMVTQARAEFEREYEQ